MAKAARGLSRKKKKPRRRSPRRAPAASSLAGSGGLKADAAVIRASRTKYGPRPNWGKREYAQVAIAALYSDGMPRNVNQSLLVRDVNAWLTRDPQYRATGLGSISRMTVLRAAGISPH
jgi:hypothetical protein